MSKKEKSLSNDLNNIYSIGNGQLEQLELHDKALTLNCMHDQQAILIGG